MIPSLNVFLRKHLFYTTLALTALMLFFSISIIKNSEYVTASTLFIGFPILILSFCFLFFSDVIGYVSYSLFSLRFFDRVDESDSKSRYEQISKWNLSPLNPSFFVSFMILIFSGLGYVFLKNHSWSLIILNALVVFPLVFYFSFKKYFILYVDYVRYKIEHFNQKVYRISLNRLLMKEILISIVINFVIVLPLASKEAFVFNSGTSTPEFIVAMLILLFCVWSILFLFSSKSKRYVLLGLFFIADTVPKRTNSTNLKKYGELSKTTRYFIWLLITFFYEIILLISLNEVFLSFDKFFIVYGLSVIPIYMGFTLEKKLAIQNSVSEAIEMYERHQFHSANILKQFKS